MSLIKKTPTIGARRKGWKAVVKREKTEYKYVQKQTLHDGTIVFVMKLSFLNKMNNNTKTSVYKTCTTLKEAALAVDLKLISCGQEPKNILKRIIS